MSTVTHTKDACSRVGLVTTTLATPRTAPIPDTFWTKHNSDASETRRSKAPGNTPTCTVCGAVLNPGNAFTVAVTDGGDTFINPDDVNDEVLADPGFMGCWDLGSSCVRLAPARVRTPYNRHPHKPS